MRHCACGWGSSYIVLTSPVTDVQLGAMAVASAFCSPIGAAASPVGTSLQPAPCGWVLGVYSGEDSLSCSGGRSSL